jgi:hypothetical protein
MLPEISKIIRTLGRTATAVPEGGEAEGIAQSCENGITIRKRRTTATLK